MSSPTASPGRRRRSAAAVGLLIVVAAGCTDDGDWQAGRSPTSIAPSTDTQRSATAADDGRVKILLALDAESAMIEVGGDEHTLTLTEPSDVLAFTDRPVRAAQRTTVAELVARWDRLFGADPPNAALSGLTQDGRSVDVPVELTSAASSGAAVSFTARRIDDGDRTALPAELHDVSLFIDDTSMCPDPTPPGGDCSTEIVYASTFVPFDSSF